MVRYTKIICTLGPASVSEEMLDKMAVRGMNVARINCGHGNQKQHQKFIDMVRMVNKKYGHKTTMLHDLAGYRIRIGNLKKRRMLTQNQILYMSAEQVETEDHVPFDYPEDLKNIKKGSHMFIDDGRLHLRIVEVTSKRLKLKVVTGGYLKERKGVNIPTLKLSNNIMTIQDESDLQFALKNKCEKIAQSFVRNKKDIQRVMELVKDVNPKCKVIAKIENEEGVKNVDSIIEACDGVMVARGDLGVTIPLYKIPLIQKHIIRHCMRRKKLAITATQMLESMIVEGRPTRAEVSDVANAILDGSDYVMLSGETSIGKYPSRTIQIMDQIVRHTEKYYYRSL